MKIIEVKRHKNAPRLKICRKTIFALNSRRKINKYSYMFLLKLNMYKEKKNETEKIQIFLSLKIFIILSKTFLFLISCGSRYHFRKAREIICSRIKTLIKLRFIFFLITYTLPEKKHFFYTLFSNHQSDLTASLFHFLSLT